MHAMFVLLLSSVCTCLCTECTVHVSCSPALSHKIFLDMFAAVQLGKLLAEFVSVVLIRNCDQLAEDRAGQGTILDPEDRSRTGQTADCCC